MDEQRRITVLKLGFFPVTADYWYGLKFPFQDAVDYTRFTWARTLPDGTVMPYSPKTVEEKPLDELLAGMRRTDARIMEHMKKKR